MITAMMIVVFFTGLVIGRYNYLRGNRAFRERCRMEEEERVKYTVQGKKARIVDLEKLDKSNQETIKKLYNDLTKLHEDYRERENTLKKQIHRDTKHDYLNGFRAGFESGKEEK